MAAEDEKKKRPEPPKAVESPLVSCLPLHVRQGTMSGSDGPVFTQCSTRIGRRPHVSACFIPNNRLTKNRMYLGSQPHLAEAMKKLGDMQVTITKVSCEGSPQSRQSIQSHPSHVRLAGLRRAGSQATSGVYSSCGSLGFSGSRQEGQREC